MAEERLPDRGDGESGRVAGDGYDVTPSDARGLWAPEAGAACGVREPTVDQRKVSSLYPRGSNWPVATDRDGDFVLAHPVDNDLQGSQDLPRMSARVR